jgi:hypothetical protein
MDANAKDWFELSAWLLAIVGGTAGLINLVAEARRSRRQRERELRWRKASAANELLSAFYGDAVFRDAMMMLDWDGRPFEIAPGTKEPIARDDIWAALARPPVPFTDKNRFIRTAMDRMFEAFDRIGHSISIGVIIHEDIKYALEYYVRVLAQNRSLVETYMTERGFDQALVFFEQCKAWNPAAAA